MQILNLNLVNFRNYSNLELSFSNSINLIIGNNGSGKTNLIEAIYMLALTKSFRGTTDGVVIKKNEEKTIIEGLIENNLKTKYSLELSKTGKKAKIRSKKVNKLSDYISNINVVLFNPDDLYLIKSTPSVRRKLLNVEISQLNNTYLKDLNNYNSLIKQRNAYLKTLYINSYASRDYLNILTEKIIDYGEKIYLKRKKFLDNINKYLADIFLDITTTEGLKVKYTSDYNNFERKTVAEKYKNTVEKDIILGKTTIGIHHDDFKFILDKDNLKDYGSEGYQKIAILSFRLAEIKLFYDIKGYYPILILDDLFSEIDKDKINNIMKYLNKEVQTFITVTDLEKVDKKLIEESNIFEVSLGKVEEKKV